MSAVAVLRAEQDAKAADEAADRAEEEFRKRQEEERKAALDAPKPDTGPELTQDEAPSRPRRLRFAAWSAGLPVRQQRLNTRPLGVSQRHTQTDDPKEPAWRKGRVTALAKAVTR
ncbi:hypothetical protein [Streptomyces lavendulocolor]|uniref:hypothetical protein n=1 Tax=Streptomyces lavendulocolor TaxID=67316 RepID=UPI003C2D75C6